MPDSEESSGFSASFTDLMTSLAVIFILLLCASLNNAFQQGQNIRENILERIKNELKEFIAKGVEIKKDEKDPLAILILVPEGLLEFKFNRSDIPPKGVDFLNVFIPKLANVIYSEDFRDEITSVVVEGHTDSKGDDEHNLKLSQDRSMEVVRQCLVALNVKSISQDTRDFFLTVLSATGRGERDLIYKSDGTEDEAKSRRVVFKIRVRSFEEKKIERFIQVTTK
ncbi:MAG: OmpA family protein [Thermodesulfovibrionales bacterium]|nr:OmpA family protein [Thermodesulfovibrionales bacterium]